MPYRIGADNGVYSSACRFCAQEASSARHNSDSIITTDCKLQRWILFASAMFGLLAGLV